MINCVLLQWTDETKTSFNVINFNVNISSPDISGLDPDLEYLVKRVPYSMPSYDPRLTNLVTEQKVGDFDSEYPTLRQWVTEYSLSERSIAEKKISVDESENDSNYIVFPTHKQLKLLTLALSIIDRKASGLTITPKQQLILDKMNAKAQKIWMNHINAEAKKAAIDINQTVNLDTDWEQQDPEQ